MKQVWMHTVGAVLLLAALVAVSLGEPTGWRPAAGPQRLRQELLSGRPFQVELEGKGINLDIVWWPPASGLDFAHALLVSVVTTTTSTPSSVETTTTKTVYVPPPRVLEREGRLLPNWRNWTWLALPDLIPAGLGHNFTVDVSIVDESSSANNETIVRRAWGVASDRLGATYLQLRVNNNTATTGADSVKHDLEPVDLDLVINAVTYGCRCYWRAVTNSDGNQTTAASASAPMYNSELRPVKNGGPHDWECVPGAGEGAPVIPAAGVEYYMYVYYAGRSVLPVIADDAPAKSYALVTTGSVAVSFTMTPSPQGEHVACPGTELAFRGAFVPDRRYRCMLWVSRTTPESSSRIVHVLATAEVLPDAPSGSRVVCTLPAAVGWEAAGNGQRDTIFGVFLSEVKTSRLVYSAVNHTIPFLTSCTAGNGGGGNGGNGGNGDNGNGNNGGGDNGGGGGGAGDGDGGNDGQGNDNGNGNNGGGDNGSDNGGGGGAGDDDGGNDGQGNDAPAAWEDATRLMWMLTCAGAALLVAFGLCSAAVTFRTHTRSVHSLNPAPVVATTV